MGNNQARFSPRTRTELMETSDGEERHWTPSSAEEHQRRSRMDASTCHLMTDATSRSHNSASRDNKSWKNSISSPSDTGDESLDHLDRHTSGWEDEGYCDTSRIHRDIDMLFSYLDGWPDEPEEQENRNQAVKSNRFACMSTLDSLVETEEDEMDDNHTDLSAPTESLSLTKETDPSKKSELTNLSITNDKIEPIMVCTPFKDKVVALAALLEKRGKNSVLEEANLPDPFQRVSSPKNNLDDNSLPSLKRSRRTKAASGEVVLPSSSHASTEPETDRWRCSSDKNGHSQPKTRNVTSASVTPLSTTRSVSRGTIDSVKNQNRPQNEDLKMDRLQTGVEAHRRRIPPVSTTPNTLQKGDIVTALYSYTNKMPGTISFIKGQSGVVMRLNTGGWCYVSLRQCEGWAPAKYWQPVRSSKNGRGHTDEQKASWMLRCLDRPDCIFLLLHFGQDGDFLVRDSSTRKGEFTLSVRHGEDVHHFAIKVNNDSKFIIGNLAFPFNKLSDIVTHYQQHTILSETFAVLESPFSVRFI